MDNNDDVGQKETRQGHLKPSISSSTTTSGGTTATEMMERRDEPLADLAPTSEAINQQKQKRAPGGSGVGRRRKLGTGTTVQPEIEGGVAVPKTNPSTSNGSGGCATERSGGKGKKYNTITTLNPKTISI